jgi:hypothetical protein
VRGGERPGVVVREKKVWRRRCAAAEFPRQTARSPACGTLSASSDTPPPHAPTRPTLSFWAVLDRAANRERGTRAGGGRCCGAGARTTCALARPPDVGRVPSASVIASVTASAKAAARRVTGVVPDAGGGVGAPLFLRNGNGRGDAEILQCASCVGLPRLPAVLGVSCTRTDAGVPLSLSGFIATAFERREMERQTPTRRARVMSL